MPPVLRASVRHDVAGLRELIKSPDFDPLVALPGDVTALHAAALAGCAEAVPLLVAAGVPLEAKLAGVAEQLASSARLLKSCRGKSTGSRRFAISVVDMSDYRGATPLCCACLAGLPEAVAALLAAGASPHDARGLTPLGNMARIIGWLVPDA